MSDNTSTLQSAVFKLNDLYMSGTYFFDERWIFDWDTRLSNADNFKNARREERALTTMTNAKVIKTRSVENWYRDQQEEQMALRGVGMWNKEEWDTADPALRLYDYIWYLDDFNYDRFLQFCEANGFKPGAAHAATLKDADSQLDTDSTPTDDISKHIAVVSLVGQTLKLKFNGVTHTIRRFDSTKRFNYSLARMLMDRPDEWVSKDDLGTRHRALKSPAKDWPKLMGFTGAFRSIFIEVDTKRQKIMLNRRKSLTPDEAEILQKAVNTLNAK